MPLGQLVPSPMPDDIGIPTRIDSYAGAVILQPYAIALPSNTIISRHECEIERDGGLGNEHERVSVARVACASRVSATGIRSDTEYRFRQRGVFVKDYTPTRTAYTYLGPWSDWVTFISAGVPDWDVFVPDIIMKGFRTLQIKWDIPDGQGSPITGYFLEYVEQSPDPETGLFMGSQDYIRLYDGTGRRDHFCDMACDDVCLTTVFVENKTNV